MSVSLKDVSGAVEAWRIIIAFAVVVVLVWLLDFLILGEPCRYCGSRWHKPHECNKRPFSSESPEAPARPSEQTKE